MQFRLRDDAQSARTTCVGVVRPNWNVETGYNAQYTRGHCFFRCADGKAFPGCRDWSGMPALSTCAADCIGLLLDLDRGEMLVYKNGALLGVMATGLTGEYCWAVATAGRGVPYSYPHAPPPIAGDGILRLEPAPVPSSSGESLEVFRSS